METYNGLVRTPADAIILFEACRIGLLPRVQRRLSEKERQSIKSGSIFVWDEREAGMRRWTDGKSWSASRVSGSFLTYREMEGKRGGGQYEKTANRDGMQSNEPDSDGGGPDGYRYKPDGLMKQSFSITTNQSQHLHLISYFSRSTQAAQQLMQPTNDPGLRHIRPEKGMYPESTVHEQSNIPPVTRGPMGSPGYTHSPNQGPLFGRSPYPYPPNSWAPPSPMHTPPPHGYPPYYHGPHSGYSPYAGHPPYNMGYPPHGYGAPPPPPTAFDRVPPPLSNNGLPPPPPHQYAQPPHNYSHGYGSGYGSYPPPPNHHAGSYPPPPPQAYGRNPLAPQEAQQPLPTAAQARPEEPRKDERQDSHQTRSPQTASAPGSNNGEAPAPQPVSSGQTIPSISAMLNGGAAQPPPRPNSRTPPGTSKGPLQDIPSHKLGFEANRDVQALRNLDRTTFKGY